MFAPDSVAKPSNVTRPLHPPLCLSYRLYDVGIKWPEVERGELISYLGRRAETTIGYVPKLGLRVAMLSPNLVSRLVSIWVGMRASARILSHVVAKKYGFVAPVQKF